MGIKMTKDNLKFLYQTTHGYRIKFFWLLLFVIFNAVTSMTFPYMIGLIVDSIFYNGDYARFFMFFSFYAVVYLINQIFNCGLNYCFAILKSSYLIHIRKMCFSHLTKIKPKILVYANSGDIIKRLDTDVDKFLDFIHFNLFFSLNDLLRLIGAIIYLTAVSKLLGLLSIVIIPIMYYVSKYFVMILSVKYRKIEDDKGILSAWIYEILNGFSEIKLLNAGNKIFCDYMSVSKKIVDEEKEASYESIKTERINAFIILLGQLMIYCVSAYYICGSHMTIGQFVTCCTYFAACAAYYKNFNDRIAGAVTNMISIARVREFLDLKEENDVIDGLNHIIEKGEIIYENVCFSYDQAPVLKGVNLHIADGECIAIVGKSGEGKSTLIDLLSGIYFKGSGCIKIDGIEIEKYSLNSLRSQIGMVQQKSVIFENTIRFNITFSEEKKEDDKIWEILKTVNLYDEIKNLSNGLDTRLGKGERELSGGQKQKISIARVLYKKPKILIFDEATSAIDGDSERKIDSVIREEFKGKTTIIIAHRFSSILRANRIIVLDRGKVAAEGQHEFLLSSCDVYRKLYYDSLSSK